MDCKTKELTNITFESLFVIYIIDKSKKSKHTVKSNKVQIAASLGWVVVALTIQKKGIHNGNANSVEQKV